MQTSLPTKAQASTVRAMPLDDRDYRVDVRRRVALSPDAPRIVVVSYQGNAAARELLRVCIAGVQRFTPEPHELWIVDNNSPMEFIRPFLDLTDVNLVDAEGLDLHRGWLVSGPLNQPDPVVILAGGVVAIVSSCITSMVTFVGFVSTTLLAWRKELNAPMPTPNQEAGKVTADSGAKAGKKSKRGAVGGRAKRVTAP